MPSIENEFMKKRPKRKSKELPGKDKCHYQIYISITGNIPSGKDIQNVSTISDISGISQVLQTSPNNKCSMIPHVYR